MKFKFDQDYHIHSRLSSCSRDPEQSAERILEYAKENGLKLTCGSDYHGDTYKPRQCGIVIPDTVTDEKSLKDYILNNQPELSIFDIIIVE